MSRPGFFFLSVFFLPWTTVQATPIFYQVQNLSGNSWEYTYTVDNQLATPIEEFTIYFDLGVYENLVITGSPTFDWDGLAIQPDPLLPDDGFADWLAFGLPIAPGEALGGFTVMFDYLVTGTPGSQFFETIDPNSFDVISEGFTRPLPSDSVPEPGILVLFWLGFAGLIFRRLRWG